MFGIGLKGGLFALIYCSWGGEFMSPGPITDALGDEIIRLPRKLLDRPGSIGEDTASPGRMGLFWTM